MKTIHTQSFKATQKLGKELARKINPGQIICLSGELGSGKTTFVQGLLTGLKVKGPYTSPTFVIMKKYESKVNLTCRQTGSQKSKVIYHLDAYRVNEKDILNLGWEEIISQPDNLVIIEWAERIKKIIPVSAKWINFSWEGEKKRKIIFK
jgi:tRNA threonylcarbamoyladenosine biosynthesis protein TsaE